MTPTTIVAGKIKPGEKFAANSDYGPAWRADQVIADPNGWEWWEFVGPFRRGGFACKTPSGRTGGLGLNGPTLVVQR